jgi:hypothetical protein
MGRRKGLTLEEFGAAALYLVLKEDCWVNRWSGPCVFGLTDEERFDLRRKRIQVDPSVNEMNISYSFEKQRRRKVGEENEPSSRDVRILEGW